MNKKADKKRTLDGVKPIPQKKKYTLILTQNERDYLLKFLQTAYDSSVSLMDLTVIKQFMEKLDHHVKDFVPPLSMLKQPNKDNESNDMK